MAYKYYRALNLVFRCEELSVEYKNLIQSKPEWLKSTFTSPKEMIWFHSKSGIYECDEAGNAIPQKIYRYFSREGLDENWTWRYSEGKLEVQDMSGNWSNYPGTLEGLLSDKQVFESDKFGNRLG